MNNKAIIILSPHTDDAELGCGGTIARMMWEGMDIHWFVFSTAEDSLPSGLPKGTLHKEFIEVTQKIGLPADNYKIFNYQVRNLPEHRQEILEILIGLKKEINPYLVIGPSLNDYHQDHLVIANEMIRAFKSSSSIISYELPWNHVTFSNQMFFRLDKKHIDKKIELLSSYKSQLIKNRAYFSSEFIYGLAKTRGIQIDSEYAEAFEVIRWIE
jgi:LmbE family N-acetylglucosaminyl deacetylase